MIVRRDTVESQIMQLIPKSPWAQPVAQLRCLRGIDTLSAIGLCAEVGDWQRFPRATHAMSFLGLVPSKYSSGQTQRRGSITKTGSAHARRLLVEAAWHYRRKPATGTNLRRRQENQSPHVIAISWRPQQRLHNGLRNQVSIKAGELHSGTKA